MSVKKSALEAKSDKELELYLKENSKFVPQAKICAFEILQTRGRIFSDEEREEIAKLIIDMQVQEPIIIHHNYKKAATLLFVSIGLSVFNILLNPQTMSSGFGIFTTICTLTIMIVIALFINKGNDIMKYILAILVGLGLLGIPFLLWNIFNSPIVGINNLIQTILQIAAVVLLFKIPKS